MPSCTIGSPCSGAERVLEQILLIFPQADIFSIIDAIPPDQRGFLQNKPVKTSFVQGLPSGKTRYRSYFPLMPLAVEQLIFPRTSGHYEQLLIRKGVLTGPDQRHLCYCHSPIRYAWDMQHQYLEQSGLTKGIKELDCAVLLHYLRLWDYRTAGGVDAFAANSAYIARRIMKVYRREAEVIYPPVAVENFQLEEKKENFYLTASRMVPYKKIDLIAEAFSRLPESKLLIIGDGPEMDRVRGKAGPNVELLGYRDNATLRSHLQRAKAFVFMAEEDFGIVPVEAQACGTPVIAFGRGGVAETVVAGQTGILFHEQSAESLAGAVRLFETQTFSLGDPPTHREIQCRGI